MDQDLNRDLEQLVAKINKKSGYQKHEKWDFFCPVCSRARVMPYGPRPWGARAIARVAVATALTTMGLWPWCGLKALVSFVPYGLIYELVFRIHTRTVLRCSQCGFDPTLALADAKRAKQEITAFHQNSTKEVIHAADQDNAESSPKTATDSLTSGSSGR